jgi:hypothetical protein
MLNKTTTLLEAKAWLRENPTESAATAARLIRSTLSLYGLLFLEINQLQLRRMGVRISSLRNHK